MEALYGVIVGGVITLIGNIINNRYSLKKQKEQFEREKEANKEEWLRTETKAESERIREIYKNALSALSIFIAHANEKDDEYEISSESKSQQVREILDWLSFIKLRFPDDQTLSKAIEDFSTFPISVTAEALRENVEKLTAREEDFFLQKPKKAASSHKVDKNKKTRTLQFSIDDDYRKKQLIKGVEINQSQQREIGLKDLTESQRRKITDIHFKNTKNIPSRIILYIPNFNDKKGEIELKGEQWKGKVNPNDVSLSEILSCWEDDFEEALEDAEKHKKNHNS